MDPKFPNTYQAAEFNEYSVAPVNYSTYGYTFRRVLVALLLFALGFALGAAAGYQYTRTYNTYANAAVFSSDDPQLAGSLAFERDGFNEPAAMFGHAVPGNPVLEKFGRFGKVFSASFDAVDSSSFNDTSSFAFTASFDLTDLTRFTTTFAERFDRFSV